MPISTTGGPVDPISLALFEAYIRERADTASWLMHLAGRMLVCDCAGSVYPAEVLRSAVSQFVPDYSAGSTKLMQRPTLNDVLVNAPANGKAS